MPQDLLVTMKKLITDRPHRSNAMKQKLYKMHRENGLTQHESAILAGYSPNTAKVACQTKGERLVKLSMAEHFDRLGMTDARLAEKVTEIATSAKKLQSCDVYVDKYGNGEYKVNQNSNDFVEVDDTGTQLRACELIGKFKKHLVTDGKNGNGQGGNQLIAITIKLDSQEATAEDVERINLGIPVNT